MSEQSPLDETPRSLSELSETELAQDWVVIAYGIMELDEFVATPETQTQVAAARGAFRQENAQHVPPEEYGARLDDVVRPILAADPNVQKKNQVLDNLLAAADTTGHHQYQALTLLAGLRRGAGEVTQDPTFVEDQIAGQFEALWLLRAGIFG